MRLLWAAVMLLSATIVTAQDIPPPREAAVQCLLIGAIGVRWQPVEQAERYALYRSTDGQNWSRVGQTERCEVVDRGGLQPGGTYFYAVAAVVGGKEQPHRELGLAENSANLVGGGDFETDVLGSKRPLCFNSMSGAGDRLEIITGGRPGSTGRQMLQITGDATAPIIRLHTPNYLVVPAGAYTVRLWARQGPGGVAGLGGRILNAEGQKCKSMVVDYFQSAVIKEADDGWRQMQGWARVVPADAHTLQLWALGWKTQGPAWMDDLEIIDERIERLARCDTAALMAETRTLIPSCPDQKLAQKAAEVLAKTEAAAAKVADTSLGVRDALLASAELLAAQDELDQVRWDLKIMGLKNPAGGAQ